MNSDLSLDDHRDFRYLHSAQIFKNIRRDRKPDKRPKKTSMNPTKHFKKN